MLKKSLLWIVREGIGRLMVLISFLSNPRRMKRSAELQREVDQRVASMSVYQYFTCPFCIKTRRAIHRLNIPMEYRDAQLRGGEHRHTLEQEGGQIKVPCLRIDHGEHSTWLYESNDIIAYLNAQFDPAQPATVKASS